ncbi:MAG: MBL fold metallo-hydrolase [Candidatus Thorarchaeota archaeon]
MSEISTDVHLIKVPTPFPVGPVNCYLIEGNPLTLIDTGPKTKEARLALDDGMGGLGYEISDVEQILLTHGNIDHFGLALDILESREKSGKSQPRVFIHSLDLPRIANHEEYMAERIDAYHDIVHTSGVPDGEGFPLPKPQLVRYYTAFGNSVPSVEAIDDDTILDSGIGKLKVIWVPGHSLGSSSFVSDSKKLIFTGDHILGDISSNPSLDFDGHLGVSMLRYFDSLDKVQTYDSYHVLPGHRTTFKNLSQRISELRIDYDDKLLQTRESLSDSAKSVYEVSRVLYGDYDTHSLVLALAETSDLLRILVERNEAKLEAIDGITYAFK